MKPLNDDQYEFTSIDDAVKTSGSKKVPQAEKTDDIALEIFASQEISFEEKEYAASPAEELSQPQGLSADHASRSVSAWPLDEPEPHTNSRGTLIAMSLILIAGLVGVWWFQHDIGQIATTDDDKIVETKVNAFIQQCSNKASGGKFSQTQSAADQLVKVFSEFSDSMVIASETATINPFTMRGNRESDAEQKELEEKRQALYREAAAMSISGILEMSDTPTAIVNGQVVRTGDKLGSFRVGKIANGRIWLHNRTLNYILR